MISKRLIIGCILLLLIVVVYFSPLKQVITFENLKIQRDYLQEYVDAYYLPSVVIYIITYSISVASFVPFVALLTMAGGMVFGVLPCVVYTSIGATTGAILAFLFVKYFIGDAIHHRYARQLVRFNRAIDRYGAYFLLTIHLVVFIPFFLINILAGLTRIRLWTFTWTTALGNLPGVFLYAYAGQQLNTIEQVGDIFSWNIIIILIIFVCLSLMPVVWNFVMGRRIRY